MITKENLVSLKSNLTIELNKIDVAHLEDLLDDISTMMDQYWATMGKSDHLLEVLGTLGQNIEDLVEITNAVSKLVMDLEDFI